MVSYGKCIWVLVEINLGRGITAMDFLRLRILNEVCLVMLCLLIEYLGTSELVLGTYWDLIDECNVNIRIIK